MKQTVVLVHDKGARVYINPSEDSIKELEQHGTVLINPDTSAVKMTPPELWMLKDGKLQPNPKKKSEQRSVQAPKRQITEIDSSKELQIHRETITKVAKALARLDERCKKENSELKQELAVVDEKVNNSDEEIAQLQDKLLQPPVDVKEVIIHKNSDDDFEKLEESLKKYIEAMSERRLHENEILSARVRRNYIMQKKTNKRIMWALVSLCIMNLTILLIL